MSQKQDSVVFLNVGRSYSPQQDLHVCYQRDAELKISSRDWVGLFRVGWSSSRDYYTFEWVPSVEEGTQATVIFAGRRLPPEDGHFYQLCYVTREVRAYCIALFSRGQTRETTLLVVQCQHQRNHCSTLKGCTRVLGHSIDNITSGYIIYGYNHHV